MDRKIRRGISLLCVLSLALSCFGASAAFAENGNIALDGTAFADSVNNTYPMFTSDPQDAFLPYKVIDGKGAEGNSRWQGDKEMNGTETDAPYIGVFWESSQTFNYISVMWEASKPTTDGYKIYYTNDEFNGEQLTEPEAAGGVAAGQQFWSEGEGNTWTELSFTPVRSDEGNNSTDVIRLEEPVTAKAVKIVGINAQTGNRTLSVWEIEIYNFTGEPYNTSRLEKAKAAADRAFGTAGNVFGYTDVSWQALEDARSVLASAIEECTNSMAGSVEAYPTQEALDAVAGELVKALSGLESASDVGANKLKNGVMFYDDGNLSAYCGDINYLTLTDGVWANDANNYQPNQDSAQGATVYIKPTQASDMDKLVMYTESTGYQFTVEYTTADVSGCTGLDDYAALSWTTLCSAPGDVEFSYDLGGSVSVYTLTFGKVENVTALKITSNAGGWYKLREVEAYCDSGNDNCITGTKKFTDSTNGNVFVATNITKAAGAGKTVKAEYTVMRDGKTATGTVTVTDAWGMISLGSLRITSADIEGGHGGDYVTGVLFENVREGDEINVVFMLE